MSSEKFAISIIIHYYYRQFWKLVSHSLNTEKIKLTKRKMFKKRTCMFNFGICLGSGNLDIIWKDIKVHYAHFTGGNNPFLKTFYKIYNKLFCIEYRTEYFIEYIINFFCIEYRTEYFIEYRINFLQNKSN